MRKIWCPNHDTGGVFSRFHTKSGSVLIHVIILLIVNETYRCDLVTVSCNCTVKHESLEVAHGDAESVICPHGWSTEQ